MRLFSLRGAGLILPVVALAIDGGDCRLDTSETGTAADAEEPRVSMLRIMA